MKFETGYKGVNKQGLTYVVVDGTIAKQTKIRFDIDKAEVITTRVYLRKGLPMHPTYGKLQPGTVFKDRKGDDFKLVKKVSNDKWLICWLKDGEAATKYAESIKSGSVSHPTDGKIREGQIWDSNRGKLTVVKYHNALKVDVKFEDGSLTTTSASALRAGSVGHPTSQLYIGQSVMTNSGWVGTVTKYNSYSDVEILWQDGSTEHHTANHVRIGAIKPLYQPFVAGVGYYGAGRFSNGLKAKGEKSPEAIYQYWVRMLNRCFNPKEVVKRSGKNYLFVSVHKDWFCFQNFAEWAISQPNWNLGYDLDKDLIGDGLEYNANSCTFLPNEVNVFLADFYTRDKYHLPIGVQYIKPQTSCSKEGYVARCHTENGREYLGYFNTPEEAYYAYKTKKEEYAGTLAEKFKDTLTVEAYERLKNFELSVVYSTGT